MEKNTMVVAKKKGFQHVCALLQADLRENRVGILPQNTDFPVDFSAEAEIQRKVLSSSDHHQLTFNLALFMAYIRTYSDILSDIWRPGLRSAPTELWIKSRDPRLAGRAPTGATYLGVSASFMITHVCVFSKPMMLVYQLAVPVYYRKSWWRRFGIQETIGEGSCWDAWTAERIHRTERWL